MQYYFQILQSLEPRDHKDVCKKEMVEKLAVAGNHQLPNPMGRDIYAGPWQTGATGDGDFTHPDDTLWRALCQNGGLEADYSGQARRKEQSLSTMDLQ